MTVFTRENGITISYTFVNDGDTEIIYTDEGNSAHISCEFTHDSGRTDYIEYNSEPSETFDVLASELVHEIDTYISDIDDPDPYLHLCYGDCSLTALYAFVEALRNSVEEEIE